MMRFADTLPLAWMLQTLIGFSLLIILVLMIRKPVARRFGAGAAYALWLLPLIRLVLPPIAIPPSWTAWMKPAVAPAEPIAAQIEPVLAVLPALAADVPLIAATPAPSLLSQLSPALIITSVAIVWAVIALILFARIWLQHRAFVRVVASDHEPVSDDLLHRARQHAARVGLARMPAVSASLVVSGPLVYAARGQNFCIVPAWFETDFTPAEQDAALTHEFMHLKRGDLIALKACSLTTSLFWFHPLVWMGARAFRVDQEAACDADVLRRTSISPHTYGATLLKAVRSGRFGAAPLAASLPLTHALKERLIRMKDGPSPMKYRALWLGVAGTAGLGIAIATASVTAEAHESRSLRLDNESIYIDGEKVENRRFKLLGDPMADIVPPAPPAPITPPSPASLPSMPSPPSPPSPPSAAELYGPDADGQNWTFEFSHADGMNMDLPIDAEMNALSAEMAKDGARISRTAMALAAAEIRGDEVKARALERELSALETAIEAKAEKMERHAAAFEARMEAWAEAFEAKMDADTVAFEASMEAHNEALEAGLEAQAAAMEAQMEAEEARFEAEMEDRVGVMHNLAEDCRDAELAPGEKRRLKATSKDGKTFEAECEDTKTQ